MVDRKMIKVVSVELKPLGILIFEEDEFGLTGLSYGERLCENSSIEKTTFIKIAIDQVKAYLDGNRTVFDVPLHLNTGTVFQKEAWGILCDIPFGELMSYGELAKKCGHPKAVRAIGMAMHRNPFSIIWPCHRVVGGNYALGGYGGGIDKKSWLLQHEGWHLSQNGRLIKLLS